MIHREEKETYVVITQPAHSWISGQLARSWGNDAFAEPSPWEEVCLAAEQHDIGFLEWELSPTLNRRSGRPHSFLDMPGDLHLDVWKRSVDRNAAYSSYAALLVSLHCAYLCEQYERVDSAEKARLVKEFLTQQRVFQKQLFDRLRAVPEYQMACDNAIVARNQRLIATWDYMSLILCFGITQSQIIKDVPGNNKTLDLTMTPMSDDPWRISLSPWPFQKQHIDIIFEGKRLHRTYDDEYEMRRALSLAEVNSYSVRLVP